MTIFKLLDKSDKESYAFYRHRDFPPQIDIRRIDGRPALSFDLIGRLFAGNDP